MEYDFAEQYEGSKKRDADIDAAFEPWWEVERVGRPFERAGLDRIWTHRDTGRRLGVEYKSDTMAHRTKHVFVETVSVAEAGKPGWGYTSCAQLLVYYVVEGQYAFLLRMHELERRLEVWETFKQSRDTSTVDEGSGERYTTRGLLVPLMEFRAAASAVVEVPCATAEGVPSREYTLPTKTGSGVLRCERKRASLTVHEGGA